MGPVPCPKREKMDARDVCEKIRNSTDAIQAGAIPANDRILGVVMSQSNPSSAVPVNDIPRVSKFREIIFCEVNETPMAFIGFRSDGLRDDTVWYQLVLTEK